MSQTTIVLVRHAHAPWTPDEGRALSDAGRAGATHIAALLCDESVAAVYASTARRAIQTVEPLAAARDLAVVTINDLRERRLSAALVADHAAAVAWCWANPDAAPPGGESILAARKRGVAVIAELAQRHAGETVVVGTHGNLMALILQHWQPAVNHAFWAQLTMPDIYALSLDDAGGSAVTRRWDVGAQLRPAL